MDLLCSPVLLMVTNSSKIWQASKEWSTQLGETVNVFWGHFITQVCFSFLQHAAQEPSSLSRGKVPALPALPIAGPPLEQQWSALVETAFSGQTRTPQTAPAPVSAALGEEGRQGKLWR